MKRKAACDIDASDDSEWKSKLEPDCRLTQVARILDSLKIYFPSCASVNLAELTKMAEWFEQEIFAAAESYEDYWNQVSAKTLEMEKKMKPDASDDMQPQGQSQISLPNQPQAQQHQNVQDTTVSSGAQSSTSFPPALPSMTHLTQTLLPNASGKRINMQSGIAESFVGSSDSQGLPSGMQSHIPHQSQQQLQNLLQSTQMPNAAGQRRINMQSGIAQNFVGSSDSQGLPSVMQSHIPQQSQQQPQNLLELTQMSNAAGQRRINMQSGIAQNFVGSSVRQGLPSVMHSHIPQQSQQQPQNLLQPTQMLNAAGPSTNTQSEIAQNSVGYVIQGVPSNINPNAHAQYLRQQHSPQQHVYASAYPQLFSSSMNSNAQTGQNAVDGREEIYQMVQAMKTKYLPYLNAISIEYQQSPPQGEGQAMLKTLDNQIKFLNLTKNKVFPAWRARIPEVERHIRNMICINWAKVSAQQQIQQPGGHPLSTQPQQQQQQQEADNQQQQQQQQQQQEADNQQQQQQQQQQEEFDKQLDAWLHATQD